MRLPQGRQRTVLEILILESLASFVAREISQARSTLIHALRLAQPQNYQRLFLDEGQALAALLRSTLYSSMRRLASVWKGFAFAHTYFSFDSVPVLRHLLTMLHPLYPRVQGWLDSTILRGTQESCVVCKTSLLPLNRQVYVADCACGP